MGEEDWRKSNEKLLNVVTQPSFSTILESKFINTDVQTKKNNSGKTNYTRKKRKIIFVVDISV